MKKQIPFQKRPAQRVAPPSGFSLQSIINNHVLLAIILLLITFCCFLPVLSASFISTWDDNAYVVDNVLIRSLSIESVKKMFSTQVGGTYVPLPLLSYAIEYKIWGLNPLQFHITNLIFHLICTLLVFSIIRMLNVKTIFAACAALIYGVHPMGVESVAWITERKDLLYCMFYFGALLLYIYYVKSDKRKLFWFLASLGVFILALFSKIQAVSLPLVLLLVDYYFSRTKVVNLFLEKIPYFLLSLVFGVAGIVVLKSVGALKINEMFTLTERVFFGLYSLSAYFLKFFAPVTMSALYPYPVTSGNTLPLVYYLSPLFIVVTGFAVYRTAGKSKAVVFGTLFFLLSIVFMLQIFGAGQGFLADRYVKVPYLGLVFVVGWGMEIFPGKFRYGTVLMWLVYSIFVLVFMESAYKRCQVWKNGESLWSDVIAKYPQRDSRPYACRGLYYRAEKDNIKALADLNVSLGLDPYDSEIMLMRGNVCFDLGQDVQAYSDYLKVLKIKMDNSLALGNLGAIFVRRGQNDSAVYYLTKSIQLDSTVATTFANRAVAYGGMGKPEESIADFKKYFSINPDDERVCMSIALTYQKLGRYPESLEWFERAISRKPGFGSYYFYRSQSYKLMGNKVKALADAIKARDLGVKLPTTYIQSLQ